MIAEIAKIRIKLDLLDNSLLNERLVSYRKEGSYSYLMQVRVVDKIEIFPPFSQINDHKIIQETQNEKIIYTINKKNEVIVKVKHRFDYEEIQIEIAKCVGKNILMMEYITTGLYFFEIAINEGLFPLHASAIAYQGGAILFSAPSGVGKSTQASLWKKENVIVINDDKPLLEIGNPIMVHGSPWCGKTLQQANISLPLRLILFICQDSKNWFEELSNQEKIVQILKNTHRSEDTKHQEKMLHNMSELIKTAKILQFHSTPTPDAVKAIKEYLNGIQ